MRVLLVDNFDSFTYNLAQQCAAHTGRWPTVVTNDAPLEALLAVAWDRVLLSPGPGSPEVPSDTGVCRALLERLVDVPILGVCLGHQLLALHGGARIKRGLRPVHGEVSLVRHDGTELFVGLPERFAATRYHSLEVDEVSLPPSLRATAWSEDGALMAIAHRELPRWGVQFHPESIATPLGSTILGRFLDGGVRGRTAVELGRGPVSSVIAERSRERSERELGERERSERELGERERSDATASEHRTRVLERWIDPAAAFHALADGVDRAFWLDGERTGGRSYLGVGGEIARVHGRSLHLSGGARAEVRHGDPWELLEALVGESRTQPGPLPFASGWVGWLGYELGDEGERVPGALPDAALLRARRMVCFDARARRVTLIAHSDEGLGAHAGADDAQQWLDATETALLALGPPPPIVRSRLPVPSLRADSDPIEYRRSIARLFEELAAGNTYEACLTTQLRGRTDVDPLSLYRILRDVNPAPYAAFLKLPEVCVLSSSPECFLRLDSDGHATSRPIKGTRRRGVDEQADRRLVDELARSEKDRAENLMIVDLVRNDLGRVCEVGSVAVPELMKVETHPTVLQLVSTVTGTLRADVGPLACVRALFPGGSMTGAPKRSTRAILAALERRPRGIYSGALGWFSSSGALDLGMTIRTIVLRPDGELSIGVGGAIVARSNPSDEIDELSAKSAALERALALAHEG